MKRKDYAKLILEAPDGLLRVDDCTYVRVDFEAIDKGSWYGFRDKPGLHYGELSIIMQPGVTVSNGLDWYNSKFQMKCAMAHSYMQHLTQIDLPYSKRKKELSNPEVLAIFHKLSTYEQATILGRFFKRLGDKMSDIREFPYALRIADCDDTYYEFHSLYLAPISAMVSGLDQPSVAWEFPSFMTELQDGWTAN